MNLRSDSRCFKIYFRVYALIFVALILLIVSQEVFKFTFPNDLMVTRTIILMIAAGYIPLLYHSVRTGSISVPPQTVSRHNLPFLFWVVVVMHIIATGGTIIILSWLLWTGAA